MFAGAVKVTINPPSGTPLAGYLADRRLERIHDPLYARILVLKDHADNWFVLVTLDVVAVDHHYVQTIRQAIEKKYQIPAKQIMVHATHTHSGPGGLIQEHSVNWQAFSKIWGPYQKSLVSKQHQQILLGVRQAIQRLEPCTIYYAHGEAKGIGANRISPKRKYDPQLQLVTIELASGKHIVLYHFACHPTVLHAENLQGSADFPGYTNKHIELDETVELAIFINGPSGDISTRFTRRESSFAEAKRLGEKLAEQVTSLFTKKQKLVTSALHFQTIPLNVSLRVMDSSETITEQLRQVEEKYQQAKEEGLPTAIQRELISQMEGLRVTKNLQQQLAGITSVSTEVQIVQLKPLSFVALPGEVFSSSGENMLRKISPEPCLILGNTNDYIGYIVPKEVMTGNHYEASMTLLDHYTDSHLIDTVIHALND